MKGNIAPEGSVFKYSACVPEQRKVTGPARVFDCEQDAYNAVVEHKIHPGDIMVIRYEGPRGAGMPEMLMETFNVIEQRNAASHTNFLDDGSGGQPGFWNNMPKTGQDSPYNLPIKHATLGVDTPFPDQMQ